MPFLEVTRKIILAVRVASSSSQHHHHPLYLIQIGGTGSLHIRGRSASFQTVAETPDFWLAYRRGIADSAAHTAYMEERLGPLGARLRSYRNARMAARKGTSTAETEAVIQEVEEKIKAGDDAKEFVTGARTSFMFFDGNGAFAWSYVSPPALYRAGRRTGAYEWGVDYLPLKGPGDPMDGRVLEGRLQGISAADLAIAVADEAEGRERVGKHWSAWVADMGDDEPAPSYVTLADV